MMAEDGLVPRAEINVTPLVDVVLVLLIIFIVITPLLQTGYDVGIPRGTGPAVLPPIAISISREGVLSLNREPVSRIELKSRLVAMLQVGLRPVLLSADDENSYGDVVTLMDLVRSSGAKRIAVDLNSLGEVAR
jgi:biopolymer transport protein TolR